MQIGIGISISGLARRRGSSPAVLFANSEPGVWLDPSDPVTVFSDTAGTTPAGVGDPVARIDDKSGNGNHATQPTLAARPILREADGLRYLEFDGVDDYLQTPSITPGTDKVQVFAGVEKLSNPASRGTVVNFVDNGFRSFSLEVPQPTVTTTRWLHAGVIALREIGHVLAVGERVLYTGLSDLAAPYLALRANGAQVAQNMSTTGGGDFKDGPLGIGDHVAPQGRRLHGRIYSLIARFGPNLDTATIESTELYVAARTGVQL